MNVQPRRSEPRTSGLASQHYTIWAKETRAVGCQAHVHSIVNLGAKMTPNTLPVSVNSSIVIALSLRFRTKILLNESYYSLWVNSEKLFQTPALPQKQPGRAQTGSNMLPGPVTFSLTGKILSNWILKNQYKLIQAAAELGWAGLSSVSIGTQIG